MLAMYAATAFIILEANDIVFSRLGLPEWTVTLLIIMLENKKVIAVLPFMNNTGDDTYDHWEYVISELMISSLSTSNELTVIDNQTITDVIQNVENVQASSIGPDIANQVASRIQVKSYIYGNYLLSGSTFRINLKLIETKTNEVLKTVLWKAKQTVFSQWLISCQMLSWII
jgi:TolB-like protein